MSVIDKKAFESRKRINQLEGRVIDAIAQSQKEHEGLLTFPEVYAVLANVLKTITGEEMKEEYNFERK